MGSVTQWTITLLWAAVILGALYQAVRSPGKANTLISASADTVTGFGKGLEGRS